MPSERLLVRPDCECASLRLQVQRLEARVRDLTHSASLQDERNNPIEAPTNQYEETSKSGAPRYRGRILRPTFAGRLPHEPSFWSSPWHLWGEDPDDQVSIESIDALSLPIADYGDSLVDDFFTHRWPQLPVLHRRTFLEQNYYHGTGSQSELSEFQVYMVFAIASADATSPGTRHRFAHRNFFQRAIRQLNAVLAADDKECIQCLLLLCLYGSNEPQSVNMWYTVGLALRLAIGIDMHRVETVAEKSVFEAEMSKRLFWSVYVMDRSMSIALGRPLGIQNSDISVPLPLQMTDEQLCEEYPVTNLSAGSRDMSTFNHVIKLRQLKTAMYETFQAPGGSVEDMTQNSDTIRRKHYIELENWLATSPRYPLAVSMFQTPEWFSIAYHQGIMSLYRPSPVLPDDSVDTLRFCVDSAISLISCYATLNAKNKVCYTFVALNSLFMAAVTLLHCLRASAVIRTELTKPVANANIDSCIRLLRAIAGERAVGERCAGIIRRLGDATLAVYDQVGEVDGRQIDTEVRSWFGLKPQSSSGHSLLFLEETPPDGDFGWNDLFGNGLEWHMLG